MYDHPRHFAGFRQEVGATVRRGAVRYREDIRIGLEHAADVFIALMHGENVASP